MKTLPFHEVREFYKRNQPDGHWLDADTMRFFKTKLPEVAYELDCGGIYFITRETNPSGKSAYTIRRQLPSGEIKTQGEFHCYPKRKDAGNALKHINAIGGPSCTT